MLAFKPQCGNKLSYHRGDSCSSSKGGNPGSGLFVIFLALAFREEENGEIRITSDRLLSLSLFLSFSVAQSNRILYILYKMLQVRVRYSITNFPCKILIAWKFN